MASEDEAEVPVAQTKAKNIRFEKNKKGVFVLPPKSDYKKVKEKQRVLRGYIGAVYRMQFFILHNFFFLFK